MRLKQINEQFQWLFYVFGLLLSCGLHVSNFYRSASFRTVLHPVDNMLSMLTMLISCRLSKTTDVSHFMTSIRPPPLRGMSSNTSKREMYHSSLQDESNCVIRNLMFGNIELHYRNISWDKA